MNDAAAPRSSLKPVWIWWTSGKDAAWSLQRLRLAPDWDVRGLLASVTRKDSRAWLHGVTGDLVEAQAASVGLPIRFIELDPEDDPPSYDEAVGRVCREVRESGAEFVAFSDLSSSRRRVRRTQLVSATGLTAVFPLWGRNSADHAQEMLQAGLKARVCSVVPTKLPRQRAGSVYDATFLANLPQHVDPCGEHDEFHTFVERAPGWNQAVAVEPGDVVDRYGLACSELFLAASASARPSARRRRHREGVFDPFEYYRRLRRVRRYVENHYDQELTNETMAHVAALAPSSFRRYFRSRVGTSFGAWLTDFRMDRARSLLRKSDSDVAEVGAQVGYPLGRSFRRAFKKNTGRSPSEFRALYLERQKPSKGGNAEASRAGEASQPAPSEHVR